MLCHTTAVATLPHGLEQSLASLHGDWRRWLRARHRVLAQSHEDIIQQASADLLVWARRRASPLESEELRRVGFRVLQRRAVDAYRDDVRKWATEPLLPEAQEAHGSDPSPQDALEFTQLLTAVVDLLSTLSKSDRELILRDELVDGMEKPTALTPAERKRLSRLREALRTQLFDKHKIDLKDR